MTEARNAKVLIEGGTWAEVVGQQGPTGPTGADGPTGPTGPAANSPIVVRARQTSTQTLSADTWTQVTGFTEDEDSDGAWASNAFTAPRAATYHVTARVFFTDAAHQRVGARLAKGGAAINGTAVQAGYSAGDEGGITLAAVVNLAVNDVLTLEAWSIVGGDTYSSAPNQSSIEIVSANAVGPTGPTGPTGPAGEWMFYG